MRKLKQVILQVTVFALFGAFVGVFANYPEYRHHDPQMALIKLNFSHAGETKEECRRLTQEELERLAPNMRRPLDCPRERVPLLVEIRLDDAIIFNESLPPSGLARDGTSTVSRRFTVSPGRHVLQALLRDSRGNTGFDYERTAEIDLRPGQNFVIDFNGEAGGFIFLL